jgi:phosphatidylinositol glycan class U
MNMDRKKAALFGAAAALRILLFTSFPGLPDLLTGRVEVSTPVTSFKRRMIRAHTILFYMQLISH